jgi:uncharacterized protein (TIGR02453 family)
VKTVIHPETIKFLKQLKKNNNRDWFNANKSVYLSAYENFLNFTQALINGISTFDRSVAGLEPKKCVFRIYRDTRFSKDKSPYKTNFGASINSGGNKTGAGGYYLHISPEGSLLAGGAYMPMPNELLAIRQEISSNGDEFKKIISNKTFKKNFGEISADKLSSAPKGFDKNDPMIEYVKLKSFVMMHDLDEKTVLSSNFVNYCVGIFKTMVPFNKFISEPLLDLK